MALTKHSVIVVIYYASHLLRIPVARADECGDGKCYKTTEVLSETFWGEALETCAGLDGTEGIWTLACPGSEDQNRVAFAAINGKKAWLGYSDLQSQDYYCESDETKMSFENLFGDEGMDDYYADDGDDPANDGLDDDYDDDPAAVSEESQCLVMRSEDGQWEPYDCQSPSFFSLCSREDVGGCREAPCKNGGSCSEASVEDTEEFSCSCPEDWVGPTCEVKVEVCDPALNPCLNGATSCHTADGGVTVTCGCKPGWEGGHCQTATTEEEGGVREEEEGDSSEVSGGGKTNGGEEAQKDPSSSRSPKVVALSLAAGGSLVALVGIMVKLRRMASRGKTAKEDRLEASTLTPVETIEEADFGMGPDVNSATAFESSY